MESLRLVVVGVVVAACSGDPGPRTPAQAPVAEDLQAVREHCDAMTGRSDDCARDPACVVGKPRKSCSGHVCTAGGPMTCETCLDQVQLGRAPARYCELRAAGLDHAACELRYPNQLARCASLADR